ncbi:MAG: tyrosine-type recombinase/integrase [Alphaproteobacteria bacterium]
MGTDPVNLRTHHRLRSVREGARKLANLPGVRVHDLRHSFASVAVSGGESLYIVGKILGHRQSRTTEIYAHLAAGDSLGKPCCPAIDRG